MSNLDMNDLYPGDRYKFVKIRGKGSYGLVGEFVDLKTNEKVAIKRMHVIEDIIDAKRMLREIRILRTFKNENLIDLKHIVYKHTDTKEKFGEVYLVTNLMDTDLGKIIRKSRSELTDEHIQFIMYQIFKGLNYLHKSNLVHRDIKPNNILANEDCEIRVCDFGFAREINNPIAIDLTEYVVTRFYRAPEIMLSSQKYTSQLDVWSVGCLFYELITGNPLFPCKNYFELIKLIIDILGKPSSSSLEFITNEHAKNYIEKMNYVPPKKASLLIKGYSNPMALDLLDKCLIFNPNERYTCEDCLKHPYFKDIFEESDINFMKIESSFEFEYNDKVSLEDIKLMILEEINLTNKDRKETEIDLDYFSKLI